MTFDLISALHFGQGFFLPNLLVIGNSSAIWPLVDPGWCLHDLQPRNALHFGQGFLPSNLVAIGHFGSLRKVTTNLFIIGITVIMHKHCYMSGHCGFWLQKLALNTTEFIHWPKEACKEELVNRDKCKGLKLHILKLKYLWAHNEWCHVEDEVRLSNTAWARIPMLWPMLSTYTNTVTLCDL